MADDIVRERTPRSLGTAALQGLGFLILTALLTVLIVVQQRTAGAYMAEFSATGPDESGHVVTGLMVLNYLSSGFQNPLVFIAEYGLHFPRVVLGLWPPLYYLVEGLWFSLLQPSTPAILLLPAFLAALLVASAGWLSAQRFGPLPGVAVGAVLMVLPGLREATVVVGLDLPLAVLMLWAAVVYADFLERPCLRGAMVFGLLASAAILTKATGLALLLLPMYVLLTRRFGLLRRGVFWLPFGLVLVVAGPWTIGTFPMVRTAAALSGHMAPHEGLAVLGQLGVVLVAMAVAGVLFVLADARRKDGPALLPVLVVLSLAFVLAERAWPLPGPDTGLPLYAPLVILAAAGGLRLMALVTSGWRTLAGLMVALVMLFAALPAVMASVSKPSLGLDPVAQTFLSETGRPPSLLVLADRSSEGALVAAVAQRDQARRSFVMPGRMVLAVRGPGPATGAPLFATPEDLLVGLDGLGVGYIALVEGSAGSEAALEEQMQDAISAHPERFKLLGRFPRPDGSGQAYLYALNRTTPVPTGPAASKP